MANKSLPEIDIKRFSKIEQELNDAGLHISDIPDDVYLRRVK